MFPYTAHWKPATERLPPSIDAMHIPSDARLKILLVDDNPTFSAAVHNYLGLLPDVQILGQAHDARAALALVRSEKPDVVVLDIAMPGMNGLELARALRALPQTPQIVFLSMHDNREYRDAAAEIGAYFVSKADFVSELLPLLEQLVLTRRQKVQPVGGVQGLST